MMANTPRIWRSSRSQAQTRTCTRRCAADEPRSLASEHANTSSSRNVARAHWTYLTSRGGAQDGSVIQRCPHDNSVTRPRPHTRHNHKGWRSGDSSPQWVPARTPTVHLGRHDGMPWVPRQHARRAQRQTMPRQKNATNERCSDKQIWKTLCAQ